MSKHRVYVGIGSNIEQEKYIQLAAKALANSFGEQCQLQLSPVYKTQAIGFDGDDFLNLVACFETSMSAIEVEKTLKAIEHRHGRRRNQEKFSARTLDIDLLLYDLDIINQDGISVPRDEIEKYAFVLCPLADIASELIHPLSKKTIQQMWLHLKEQKNAGNLEQIDFTWSL